MNGSIAALMIVCASGSSLAQVSSGVPTGVAPGTNDYIFTLHSGVDASGLAKELSLAPHHVFRHALNGFAARLSGARARALAHDPRIVAVEKDGDIVACSGGACLFNYPEGQQITPDGLIRMGITNFPLAQMHGRDCRLNVNVAIVDTGVDLYNYDLNVVQAVDFTGDNPGAFDWNGHGTHVAGTIGALDNGYGLLGVAPGVNIWDLEVIGPTNHSWANFLAAMDFVVQHSNDIQVVNASLQGFPDAANGSPETAIEQAVSNVVSRGIVFVAAAGNGAGDGSLGRDVYGLDGLFGTGDDILPAALPEALTVSAMVYGQGWCDSSTNLTLSGNSQTSASALLPTTPCSRLAKP